MAQGLYILGVLLALWGVGGRLSAEAAHQSSEIVLDAQSLRRWSDSSEMSEQQLTQKLLDAGVRSLAVAEMHLEELTEEGRLVAQTGSEFQLSLASGALGELSEPEKASLSLLTKSGGTFLIFTSPDGDQPLLEQSRILFGEDVTTLLDGRVLYLPVPRRSLKTAGLGFDVAGLSALQGRGFSLWLRPENRDGLTAEKLKTLYQTWEKIPGVQGVIFGGGPNEALGYPDLLEESAAELERLKWKVGYIELPPKAQQKGIETMVRELPGQTVRVMAVSPAHQAKLSAFRVLGMYSLGARERNIRVLYVRPYAVAGRPELDQEFLFQLPVELEQAGPASVFPESQNSGPPQWLTLALSVSAGALAMLVLGELGLTYRPYWWALLVVLPLGAVLATAIGKGALIRSLLALAVGIAAPVYAFARWVFPLVNEPHPESGVSTGLKGLLICSLVSVSAGLFLAAFLSDTTFLLGLDRFRGVKLLTLGTPLLIVAAFVLKRYSPKQLMAGLKSYVAVYQALIAGGLLLVLGLLYLRSGNDAGGTASESERTLRVILDRALGVRPRFKEFMVAHPAMVLSPLFAKETGFLPSLVLILLAGIGQAGIVDTFAHIHTPLDVTLIRVGLGVALGAIIGSAATLLVRQLSSKVKRFLPGAE